MNGPRYNDADTAEGRLAAIVMELLSTIERRNHREGRSDIVDYADIEAALRPYLKKEMLFVRLDTIRDARVATRARLTEMEARLFQEAADAEQAIQQARAAAAGDVA